MGNHCQSRKSPKKKSPAQREALGKARVFRHSGVGAQARRSPEDKENVSPGAIQRGKGDTTSYARPTAILHEALNAPNEAHDRSNLSRAHLLRQLQIKERENASLHRRIVVYQSKHHNQHRQLLRARRSLAILGDRFRAFQKSHKYALHQSESTRRQLAEREVRARHDAEAAFKRMDVENTQLKIAVRAVHRKVQILKKRLARVPRMIERKLMKEKGRPLTWRIRHKGVYTAQARMLARTLVRYGCAQERVGDVLRLMGRAFGVSVEGRMSARTVRRAMLELGAASDIQTAYEILHAKCFTISGDATTNRSVNKEAQHAVIMLPSADRNSLVPKNRLLGVHATTDHTSETQFEGWQSKFKHLTTSFNNSPLSHRIGKTIDLETFAMKLQGVGGDHAADQLKTTRKMHEWKKEMTYVALARKQLASGVDPSHAFQSLTSEVTASVIAAAGGLVAWERLSSEDRVDLFSAKLHAVTLERGKEVYNGLPEEERRPLDIFVRLGCAMHKDLNAVKGGAVAMGAAWVDIGATPPILLANKENASTLRDVDPDLLEMGSSCAAAAEELSPAELRALESSTRGAVKLTTLAGALFNHSDEKRGYHDMYVFYFQEIVGHPLRFPDTSNTRYQSHAVAAAELLTHLPHYIQFLEVMRDKKTKPGFTNMEENVYKGLHDPATLTELAVLALYGEAVTHPYMRVVRQPDINGLHLGPLHDQVKEYIKTLIENPDVLIRAPDPADTHTTALDGKPWEHPDAVAAIRNMAPDLPHLKSLLVRFLSGSLRTWEKFTIEFAAGGAIDSLSTAERETAWIMPTNDHNEGVLGGDRVWTRENPNGSEAIFNAEKKAERNETEEFIAEHLSTKEDQSSLMSVAREMENQHHESERRKQLTKHIVTTARQNAQEAADKKEKEVEHMRQLGLRELVFDRARIERMTVPSLEEQLEVYRTLHKMDIRKKSRMRLREEKLTALLNAVEQHLQKNPHLIPTLTHT